MAITYSLGGAAPTHSSVSAFVSSQAHWLQSLHDQATEFYRTYAQLLQTDQQKTDAQIDFTTYPDDKYRLDILGTIMAQLVAFTEGGAAVQVVDCRNLCAQIINVAG